MRETCAPCNPAIDDSKGLPVPELQLSFDVLGFGPEFLQQVPHVRVPAKPKKGRKRAAFASAVPGDPYGLIALRYRRQFGLRHSYSLADFAKAALAVGELPDERQLRCFAYCIVVAHAVASRYFLTPEETFAKERNVQQFSGIRHICQYIAVKNGGFTTGQVGRVFGRHHASVRHAVDEVEDKREYSDSVDSEISNLENVILDLWALAGNGEGIRERLDLIV